MVNAQEPFTMLQPDVTECELRWCVRVTRSMTVTNSTFDPRRIRQYRVDLNHGRFRPSSFQALRKWYTFTASNEFGLFLGNRSFSVDVNEDNGIKRFIEDISITARDDSFFLPLANSTDRTETVTLIARSMTYALGQSLSGTNLEGETITSEQYIRVDWPWIALPLARVVMSIAFMVCTLIHTLRKSVTPWKSSNTVSLLIGMVGWGDNKLEATSWRDVKERSKGMKGQLFPNHGSRQRLYRAV
jgi:hypothetical protein